MEFIKENWFYLYSIIFIVFVIKNFIIINNNNNKVKAEIKLLSIVLGILNTIWFIIGLYSSEKNLFIALIIFTYIVPLLYGIYNGLNVDIKKDNSISNLKADIENYSEEIINSKNGKKFTSFISIIQLVIILLILVSHYKIALFYLFNN